MAETDKTYRLKPNQPYFDVGRLPDQSQAVMGLQYDEVVLVRFGSLGEFDRVELRKLANAWTVDEAAAENAIKQWQLEIGFQPRTIRIKPFFIDKLEIGIRELPEHLQELIDSPAAIDDERRRNLEDDLRDWRKNGDFVFCWVEDYFVDRSGEVTSS